MEAFEQSKKSLIERFFVFLRKKRESKELKLFERVNKFRIFLDEMNKKDPNYDDVKGFVVLCEEAYKIAGQRLHLAEKIKSVSDKMLEVHCFDALSDEDAAIIKNLLDRFASLSRERNGLMYQMTSFNNAITYMKDLEEDANSALDTISDSEKRQRILKHDIAYLEGEKMELEYEKGFLEKGQRFVYLFTIIMISSFAVGAIVLAFLYMFRNESIFFALSILIFLLIFLMFLLSLFKRRIAYELQLNVKKRKRVVELLNKKNAVYAHYINFLNYEYRKYKVGSSQALKNNLNDYANYKHLATRLDSIRNIMYQTGNEIEAFLRSRNITNIKTSLEKFAQTVNIDDKRQYFRELLNEKNILESNLLKLDNRHEEIWDLLAELEAADETQDKIMSQILQSYLNEVSKLFGRIDSYEV